MTSRTLRLRSLVDLLASQPCGDWVREGPDLRCARDIVSCSQARGFAKRDSGKLGPTQATLDTRVS